MKTCLKSGLIVIMGFVFVIVGTSTGDTEEEIAYSGFLENYPSFEPDKDRKGALIYHKPGVSLKDYSKVLMDPVEIWYAPDCKYKGIRPDELKILADAFRAAIVSELEPDYPVVSKTGRDVLCIRMAITNVHVRGPTTSFSISKRKKAGVFDLSLKAPSMEMRTHSMSLQDATIEGELLDSQNNERLAALIDRQDKERSVAGKSTTVQEDGTSWEEIERILNFYAKRLRGRLDTELGAQ